MNRRPLFLAVTLAVLAAALAAGAFRLGDQVSVSLHLIVEPDE